MPSTKQQQKNCLFIGGDSWIRILCMLVTNFDQSWSALHIICKMFTRLLTSTSLLTLIHPHISASLCNVVPANLMLNLREVSVSLPFYSLRSYPYLGNVQTMRLIENDMPNFPLESCPLWKFFDGPHGYLNESAHLETLFWLTSGNIKKTTWVPSFTGSLRSLVLYNAPVSLSALTCLTKLEYLGLLGGCIDPDVECKSDEFPNLTTLFCKGIYSLHLFENSFIHIKKLILVGKVWDDVVEKSKALGYAAFDFSNIEELAVGYYDAISLEKTSSLLVLHLISGRLLKDQDARVFCHFNNQLRLISIGLNIRLRLGGKMIKKETRRLIPRFKNCSIRNGDLYASQKWNVPHSSILSVREQLLIKYE